MAAGSPRIINLEEGWNNEIKKNAIDRLEAILNGGLDKKQSKMFTPAEYAQTYTTCYNMCTQVSEYIYIYMPLLPPGGAVSS